ncbi:hypothetical protein QOZ80_8AG0620800 [Eleusine coracana subsp. coracana]|nr:hypothetical protein QOZ80_8AG0620800 [Eleusine coracana subsp. coracana]
MPPKDAAAQGASGGIGCRLNVLPDPILLRVLCHLKAWEAVRTCLLSKRWRSLWASALRLDLRQPCGCRGGGGEFDNHRRAEQFAAFVKHLLFRRRPLLRLDALRLCWSHSAYEGDSDTWITHAVRHGAKKIELSGAHHAGYPLPDYLSFVPGDTSDEMRLKIVKLIRVRLDGTTLTQLCSRCSSLEELELIDCLIEGKEIQSTSLRSLNLISCKFVDDFRLDSSNLVSLRCIRPFGYVPRTQYMKHLVTVTIVLDDLCLRNDRQWPPKEEKKEEFHDDGDFFAHARPEDSDDNSLAHSPTEESGDNNHNESDGSSNYYDSDWSGPSDDEGDDRMVCYSLIADEHKKKPYKFLIDGNNRSADSGSPRDDCGGNSNFGGNGMLCSLSNVKTMELLAHPGELVLTRELKSCPNFKKLKTLSLGEWCMTPQLDALATILNHSPNLENLFLHLDLAFNSRVGINPQGSSFSCTNLKRVMITCCNRDVMVHKLAEFLRGNGIPNEKIFVHRTANSGSARKNPADELDDFAAILVKMASCTDDSCDSVV